MEFTYWVLTFLFFVGLIAATPQFNDYMRSKYKSRQKMALSDSLSNVRITDPISNVVYRVLSLTEEGDTFSIATETVHGPRMSKTFIELSESDFKHSVKETLITGKINYRLTKEYIRRTDNTYIQRPPDDDDSLSEKYDKDELNQLSSENFKRNMALEGKVKELEANRQEDINDAIDRTSRLSSSKYRGDN